MTQTKKWLYGKSWEQYPIEASQIWQAGTGRIAVHNLFDPLPPFMYEADCLFIDPPWNQGNINSFYTKAGRTDYILDFNVFVDRLFACIAEIAPVTCYLEIGKQYVANFQKRLAAQYPYVQRWSTTYYKKFPCFILRGSHIMYDGPDLAGIDEAKCIEIIAENEQYYAIGDLCMGRGLVGYHAHKAGKSFVGTELNKRRLAVLMESIAKEGGHIERLS